MKIKQKTKQLKKFYFYNFATLLYIISLFPFWIWKWLYINKKIKNTFSDFTNNFTKFGKNDPLYLGVEKYSIDVLKYDAKLKNEERLAFDLNLWKTLNVQEIEILKDSISIQSLVIVNKNCTNNWVIGLHGWTENKWLGLRLVKHFYDNGYNVITYDARNHGKSATVPTTIGYNEKNDLYEVIQYLNKNYKPKNIGIIGNSMGGATIIEFIKSYNSQWKQLNMSWSISDCAFSSMRLQARWMSWTIFDRHWLWTNYTVRKNTKITNNFDINKLNPARNLHLAAKIPLLIIHGKKDEFIPISMAKQIYNNKIKYEKIKISKLSIFNNANHVESISSDYERYCEETLNFAKLYEKR